MRRKKMNKETAPIILGMNDAGLKTLRTVSKSIESIDDSIRDLADKMLASMRKSHGVGLSAVQIGVLKRIIVVEHNHEPKIEAFVLVNPEITWTSKKEVNDEEGCLSFPDLFGMVRRPEKIEYKGLDLDGKEIRGKASGLFARVIQHEIDHLNGVLFMDRVDGDLYTYEKQSDTEEL